MNCPLAGRSFAFDVTRDAYNRLINTMTPNNKTGPLHNFLVATVRDQNREALAELLATTPGAEIALGGALFEAYSPDLDVVVKKPSA